MAIEFIKFEDRDFLIEKGWTRVGMHCSKLTDMWTHPVHSVRNPPKIIPSADIAETFVAHHDKNGNPVGIDFEKPGFVHLTREQAFRAEGFHRADVIRRF